MPTDFLSLFRTLESAGIRYVVVGGLAVLLHGVDRVTADIDLVVDLTPEEATKAVGALIDAGMRPALPVQVHEFSDPVARQRWRDERGMLVLSFWDPQNKRPTVDVFTESPLPFPALWSAANLVTLSGCPVRVASLEHLIAIKRQAGRPRDLEDIARLEQIMRDRSDKP